MTTSPTPPNPEPKNIWAQLASISHELRTPMSSIINFSFLLLRQPLSTEQRDGLETIQASARHLFELINNLIDFLKLEAGQIEVMQYPVEVRACIDQALKPIAERMSNQPSLRLVKHIADDVPSWILTDHFRLQQILGSLLDNAVWFTDEGEIVIDVTRETHPTNTNLILHFTIQDTGKGIPQDQLASFFAPFSQEPNPARRYSGLALELSNSRRLVELLGGALWAESDGVQGHGATFHLTLPTQLAEAQPETTTNPKPPEFYEPEFAVSHPLTILVVDNYSGFVTRPLKELGYIVESVTSGLEAVGLWQQQTYEVVIVNVHLTPAYSRSQVKAMPSGIETARRLRTIHPLFHPNRPQPYIIALHNRLDTEASRDECLAAGMNDYLEHFVKNPELKFALERAWQSLHP